MGRGTSLPDRIPENTTETPVSMLGPTHLFGSLCFYSFGLVYLVLLDSRYMFVSNWAFGTLCAVSWFALRGRAPDAVRASVFIAVVYLGLVNVGVHVGGGLVPMVFWGLSIAIAATFVHELRGVLVWAALSAGFYPLMAFLRSGPLAAQIVSTTPDQDVVLTVATYIGLLSFITFSFSLFRAKLTERSRQLRKSEERWHFALEGNGDGVWDWKGIPVQRQLLFRAPLSVCCP